MNRFLFVIAIIVAVLGGARPAVAQSTLPEVTCYECRSPYRFPRDFRNFAYNQVFGPNGTMSYEEADIFRVINPAGQGLVVDMNMDLVVLQLRLGDIPIPLPYPIGVDVQVILIFDNGDQISYMIEPRAHGGELPVGGPRGRRGAGAGAGAGSGGGSGGPPSGGSGDSGGYGSSGSGASSGQVCGITRVDGGRGRRTCIDP